MQLFYWIIELPCFLYMYFQARHDKDVQAAATKGGKNDKQGKNGGKGGNNTTV